MPQNTKQHGLWDELHELSLKQMHHFEPKDEEAQALMDKQETTAGMIRDDQSNGEFPQISSRKKS